MKWLPYLAVTCLAAQHTLIWPDFVHALTHFPEGELCHPVRWWSEAADWGHTRAAECKPKGLPYPASINQLSMIFMGIWLANGFRVGASVSYFPPLTRLRPSPSVRFCGFSVGWKMMDRNSLRFRNWNLVERDLLELEFWERRGIGFWKHKVWRYINIWICINPSER